MPDSLLEKIRGLIKQWMAYKRPPRRDDSHDDRRCPQCEITGCCADELEQILELDENKKI